MFPLASGASKLRRDEPRDLHSGSSGNPHLEASSFLYPRETIHRDQGMGVLGTVDGKLKGGIISHEGSSGLMGRQIEGRAKWIFRDKQAPIAGQGPRNGRGQRKQGSPVELPRG